MGLPCSVNETAFQEAVPSYAVTRNTAILLAWACAGADNGESSGNACSAEAEEFCKSLNSTDGVPYCGVAGLDSQSVDASLWTDSYLVPCESEFRGLLSATAGGDLESLPSAGCVDLGERLFAAGCVGPCEYMQKLHDDVQQACINATSTDCTTTGSANAKSLICEQSLFTANITCGR